MADLQSNNTTNNKKLKQIKKSINNLFNKLMERNKQYKERGHKKLRHNKTRMSNK